MKRYITVTLALWFIIGILSLCWNLYDERKERETLAFNNGRTFFSQLIQARKWNAQHGGIYVPVTQDVQPNPYLVDPLQDVITQEGLRLTKINPAFMTRQLAEISAKEAGVQFHITSLKPVRPENKATDWERKWLLDFQNGIKERGKFFRNSENTQFRYMAPLFVKEECLKCHAKQGYDVGDIRGGISLTLPVELPLLNWKMILSHLFVIITGAVLILFFGDRLSKQQKQLIKTNISLQEEVQNRKQAQQELQNARDSLEETVQERTANLRQINTALNEFAHIISHDLQQPLMAVQSFSSRIRKKCQDALNDQCLVYLDKIDSSSTRMQELIDGLLQYSRVTSDHGRFERVDLAVILKNVLDDLSIQIEQAGAVIRASSLPVIEAYSLQMRQLFQNLLSNSLKYRHTEKRLEISVEAERLDNQPDGIDKYRITVEDNGVGFEMEHSERIFNIFEQLPQDGEYQGTGIGLSICRTIVEHHNGSITAEGTPGHGAKFIITLPMRRRELS